MLRAKRDNQSIITSLVLKLKTAAVTRPSANQIPELAVKTLQGIASPANQSTTKKVCINLKLWLAGQH